MFPTIKHIDDLWPFVQGNVQIRQKDGPQGMKIVSYQVQDEDTFTGEHEDFERECRGFTFYPDGTVAARTLHKFFNIGQREDVQAEKLSWQGVTRIMVKRDGSMITPVVLPDGTLKCKTKNSFATKEAELADETIKVTEGGAEWIKAIIAKGCTPTFEITSAKYPIVLRYTSTELTLLHIRNNENGLYFCEEALLASKCPFPIVENVQSQFLGDGLPQNLVSWEKLKEYALKAEKVEGVVIQFGQEMVKLKTVWYCDLHHSVTFTRWRDIARTVCADKSDDLKGAFATVGRSIEPILEVERKVGAYIANLQAAVELHAGNGRALNRTAKDMALAFKERADFGLVMRAFRGQEVNYMEYYVRHQLDLDWNLEVVEEIIE